LFKRRSSLHFVIFIEKEMTLLLCEKFFFAIFACTI